MIEYVIRQVEHKDINGCFEVEDSCFPPEEAASLESITIRANEFPQGFYIAASDGRIVGQVNSGATDKDDISDEEFKKLIGHKADGKNRVIFSLSVHPEYQRNGIAGKLLDEYIKCSKGQCENIMLLCKSNLIPFYERFGFVVRGLSASDHGGAEWYEMVLSFNG